MNKLASSEAAWSLLNEGVSTTRVEVHRLKHSLNRTMSLIETSKQRDHIYQVAGDLIVDIPKRLAQIERHLDRTSLALAAMGQTFLKARLPQPDRTRVEEAIQTGNPVTRRSAQAVVAKYLSRKADLSPPVGSPGANCLVQKRIVDRVISKELEHQMVKLMQSGKGLEKGTESKVYSPFWEKGPGEFLEKLLFSPHAQYRMDLRGVTVDQVVATLAKALRVLKTWKEKGDPKYAKVLSELRTENRLRWLDPSNNLFITLAPNGNKTAEVVTVFFQGKPDPKPQACPKQASDMEDYSGFRTFVSPSRTDRKEQVLPEPWSFSKPVGPFALNGPGSPPQKYPRTVPEAGRPHSNNGVVMTPAGSAIPKRSFDRQEEQRGKAKRYHERYYQRNKREINRDSKKWYQKNRNRSDFKRRRDLYEKNPKKYERRPYGGYGTDAERSKDVRQEQKKAELVKRYLNRGGGYFDRVHRQDNDPKPPILAPDTFGNPIMDNPGPGRMMPLFNDYANKKAALIQDVLAHVGPNVLGPAKSLRPKLARVDKKNRIWAFKVPGSKAPYEVRLRMSPGKVSKRTDIYMSCSCPFWTYQGPEHWAKVGGYLLGSPKGTATSPKEKDPKHQHGLCKHSMAVVSFVLNSGWEIP